MPRSGGASSGSRKRKRLRIGNNNVTFGKSLKGITDSTALFKAKDFSGLRERLERDGFLWVRGALARAKVLTARNAMISALRKKGAIANGGSMDQTPAERPQQAPIADLKCQGWCVDAESGGVVGDRDPDVAMWREVGNSRALVDVYDGADLKQFVRSLFGKRARTLPGCTWLRAKGRGELTAEHVDYFYFYKNTSIMGGASALYESSGTSVACRLYHRCDAGPKGTECEDCGRYQPCEGCGKANNPESMLICDICGAGFHLGCHTPPLKAIPDSEEWHCRQCADSPVPVYTCWVPLGDLGQEQGLLAIKEGTHTLAGYKKPVINGLLPREYRKNAARAAWSIPDRVAAGDIILFNLKTVHAASQNVSTEFRLSLDTRVVARPIVAKRFRKALESECSAPNRV